MEDQFESDNTTIAAPREPWFLRSPWRLHGTLFLTIALPTILLIAFITLPVRRQLAAHAEEESALLSRLLAEAVDEEFNGLTTYLSSHSNHPSLTESLIAKDTDGIVAGLRRLVEGNPRFTRAFITDPAGVERYDFPHDPSVIGVSFAHRDWYRGVSTSQRTYISEIYRRAAKKEHWWQ